jgi:hypothetical protein
MRTRAIGVALSATLLAALAACGPGHGTLGTASGVESSAKAVASSSANVAAENAVKQQVTTCLDATPTIKLVSSDGRQQVITCLKGLVPEAKQDQFKQCVASAAATDKFWTKAGRETFENSGVATCVTQATGTAAPASATPSATASK